MVIELEDRNTGNAETVLETNMVTNAVNDIPGVNPNAFRDAVYKKLIELCIDICKRNGKNKLIWFGDKDKTLNYSPKSGILASVSLAQFILESGYGKSELAQNANNIFGMKCSLSGNRL